jgi:hypothetical protein
MLKLVVRAMASLAVVGVLFVGLGATMAGAQSADDCVFDGDLQSYLDCLAGVGGDQDGNGPDVIGADVSNGAGDGSQLARTGSDVGSLVGIGSALVILGGAVIYGVHQRRSARPA